MLTAYNTFKTLINDTINVETIFDYVTNQAKVPINCDDLLRWEWAQCVSAFDKLIHDLVRLGMLQTFNNQRIETAKFKGFVIDYSTYSSMKVAANPVLIFEQRIILKNSTLSFQAPDKVADALSYIWDENNKWDKIAMQVGMSKSDCVTMLKNIVSRRNQIVHEGDYIDPFATQRQDIYPTDVQATKTFLLKIGEAIYNLVKL